MGAACNCISGTLYYGLSGGAQTHGSKTHKRRRSRDEWYKDASGWACRGWEAAPWRVPGIVLDSCMTVARRPPLQSRHACPDTILPRTAHGPAPLVAAPLALWRPVVRAGLLQIRRLDLRMARLPSHRGMVSRPSRCEAHLPASRLQRTPRMSWSSQTPRFATPRRTSTQASFRAYTTGSIMQASARAGNTSTISGQTWLFFSATCSPLAAK